MFFSFKKKKIVDANLLHSVHLENSSIITTIRITYLLWYFFRHSQRPQQNIIIEQEFYFFQIIFQKEKNILITKEQ